MGKGVWGINKALVRIGLGLAFAAIVTGAGAGAILVAAGIRGTPDYGFILVEETNTMGLNAIPLDGDARRQVEWDCARRSLRSDSPEVTPDRATRCMLVYEVDVAGVRVSSEARRIRAFPHSVRIGEALAAFTDLVDSEDAGPAVERSPIVDNRLRLYTGTLTITGIDGDGEAHLVFDGERFDLKPGEAWSRARVREGSAVGEIAPGLEWESRLTRAFKANCPVSRVTILNHGLWEKGRVAGWGG